MGRSSAGLSGAIDKQGNLKGSASGIGIPIPLFPTEAMGVMSGSIRKSPTTPESPSGEGSNPQTVKKIPVTRLPDSRTNPTFREDDSPKTEPAKPSVVEIPVQRPLVDPRRDPMPGKPKDLRELLGPGFVCPDPSMRILMADGSEKKAGDLVVGDLVKTYHEKSFVLGEYKVEFIDIINDVEKIKLIFDKSEIICSLSHKLYVGDSWKEAKDLVIGDKVSDKELISIEDAEVGDVVRITIEDAHTYICEGLLSHNKSPLRDPKTGDIIPQPKVFPTPRRDGRGRGFGRRMLPRPFVDPRPFPPKPDVTPPEVPLPKERDTSPRGPAPFSPDERAMAKEAFFERMFNRAYERKQSRAMDQEERRNVMDARRDESDMRDSEKGMRDERGDRRGTRGRRMRRRDFTRKRSKMEGRRSREERAAFRDQYVSTLR